MKKLSFIIALVFSVIGLESAMACTNLIVGKKASVDGQFMRWGYDTPGYDQQFIDAIGGSTGERYKLKEVIERRER
jgi:hypothetical protein